MTKRVDYDPRAPDDYRTVCDILAAVRDRPVAIPCACDSATCLVCEALRECDEPTRRMTRDELQAALDGQ